MAGDGSPRGFGQRKLGHDYTAANKYFITICAYASGCIFGQVRNSAMVLAPYGVIASSVWYSIPDHWRGVALGAFVVMPNHIHGVVVLNGYQGHSLSTIIGGYKSAVTKQINRKRAPDDRIPIWEKSFHDVIIDSPELMAEVTTYIGNNPAQWSQDRFYVE